MSIKIDLTGKNVLITGDGGDIGSAITKKFLEAGANCFCFDKYFKNLKRDKIKNKFLNKVTLIKVDFEKKNFTQIFL